MSLGLTALAYAPLAIVEHPAHMPSVDVVAAILTLGLVCTALAFLLFFRLIAEVGPVRATVVTYLSPAVAVLLGVVFLGEPFTFAIAVGCALIVAGSVLANLRDGALGATGAPP